MNLKKNNAQAEAKKRFAEECKVINLKYEYHGYIGDERYAIVSELSEAELLEKYPDIIQMYVPFVLLSVEQGRVLEEFDRNEDKFEKRQKRDKDILRFAEDETARLHSRLIEEDFVDAIVRSETRRFECEVLKKAFEVLTPLQRRRVIYRYVYKKTLKEIAEQECVHLNVVDRSVHAGIEKMRRFFEKNGMKTT